MFNMLCTYTKLLVVICIAVRVNTENYPVGLNIFSWLPAFLSLVVNEHFAVVLTVGKLLFERCHVQF